MNSSVVKVFFLEQISLLHSGQPPFSDFKKLSALT